MNRTIRVVILGFSLAFLSTMLFSQTPGDPRLKKALDTLGLKYTVTDSGNYSVTFTMENDKERSQLVRIVSKTETYRGVEIREIWTVAAVLDEYPSDELLYRLMEENSKGKLGAWAMEASSDGVYIMYTTKVPVGLKNDELKFFAYFVAEIADELEVELLGTDDN